MALGYETLLTIHAAQPQTPKRPSFSSRRKEAKMALFEHQHGLLQNELTNYPIITLIAPNGVTRIAGAKV